MKIEINITTETIEMFVEAEIVTAPDGAVCEYDHKIPTGTVSFTDDADVRVCRKHLLEQIGVVIDDAISSAK